MNSLLAMSNNVVTKMWLDLDLKAKPVYSLQQQQVKSGGKFNTASQSTSLHKLGILIFTGPKESMEL